MRITRKRVTEMSSNEITEIECFLDANFSTTFHDPDFNHVVSNVFKTDFFYDAAYNDGGELVGLCPYHSLRKGLLTMTYSNPAMYGVPYGGWIIKCQGVSVIELLKHSKISCIEAITYWSVPQLNNNGYSRVKNKKRFQTAIISLQQDEDSIWHKVINSKRRNMIRKAMKNNVEIEKVDCTRFEEYYRLTQKKVPCGHMKTKLREYYTGILKQYIPKRKAMILLAKVRSNYVAGVIVLRNKHIAHYWLGASRKNVDNLGQGELLQWEAIRWAKRNGSGYYDLCVIEPERLPNIATFKLGFSKETVPFYCITKRTLAYRALSKLQRIVAN